LNLASRLNRLEERIGRGPGGECPRPQTGAIIKKGQPLPPKEKVAVCKNCGGRHVLEIEHVVIRPGKQPSGNGRHYGPSERNQ
jgi:hypothetical protein